LQEESLVAGPAQVTPPLCLGCYSLLTEQSATPCADCGWPVCSDKCARTSAHRAECEITKFKRGAKVKSFNAGLDGFRSTGNKYTCYLTTLLITWVI